VVERAVGVDHRVFEQAVGVDVGQQGGHGGGWVEDGADDKGYHCHGCARGWRDCAVHDVIALQDIGYENCNRTHDIGCSQLSASRESHDPARLSPQVEHGTGRRLRCLSASSEIERREPIRPSLAGKTAGSEGFPGGGCAARGKASSSATVAHTSSLGELGRRLELVAIARLLSSCRGPKPVTRQGFGKGADERFSYKLT
jgi:hypothetical protein